MAAAIHSWQDLAKAKRDSILESIPKEWLIGPIPSVEAQRDVTGDYICKMLSTSEIEITETDATGIVNKIASGEWSAEEVTRAFCHRAVLAHQLVFTTRAAPDPRNPSVVNRRLGQLFVRNIL